MLEEKNKGTGLSLFSEKVGWTYPERLRQISKLNIRNKTLSGLYALDGVFVDVEPEPLQPVRQLAL